MRRRKGFPRSLFGWLEHRLHQWGIRQLPTVFPGTALEQPDLVVLGALAASLDGASRGQLNQSSTAPVDLLLQFIECEEIRFVGAGDRSLWLGSTDQYCKQMVHLCWKLVDKIEVAAAVSIAFPQHIREAMGKDALRTWALCLIQQHFGTTINGFNFVDSWRDGSAFWALLAHTEPSWREFSLDLNLKQTSWTANLERAFKGFGSVGIPHILDAYEVANAKSVDAELKSQIILYVALVFNHCMSCGI